MAIQKYDIGRPTESGGDFEERWWSQKNFPVIGSRGEVAYIIHSVEDVTEKHHIEAERQLFAALVENSSDFIGIADPSGKPIYLNPAGRRMVGLAPDHPVGETQIPEYYSPEERAFASEVIVKRMVEQGRWSGETHFRNWKTGEAIPVSDEHFMIRDAGSSEILGMGTITRDISEARRVTTEREQLLALAKDLFDQASDSIFIADLDGRYTEVNATACKMLGYRREELIGKSIVDLIPPEDVPRLAAERDYLLSAGTVQVSEWTLLRKDGTPIPVEVSARILPDGRWQAFVRDISKRKRIERALQESEERFRLTIDEAPIGMALVALDGRFVRVNRALCEIVGYSSDELTGLTFQAITHPDDLDGDLALAGQLARGEIPRYQLEKRYIRKDGTIVDSLLSVSILRSRESAPRYYIVQIEDITERKRIEGELKAANASLDAIIENIPLMLFMKESQSLRFVRFNRAGENLLGWPRQTLIGKNDHDFWPKKQAEFFVEKDRETLKSGSVVDIPEEPIQTHRQGVRILHTKKVPILDTAGNPIYLLGISEDITERRRIEKEQQFLAEVSVALSASLECEQTLATLAQLVVQNVADWCAVDVMEEHGRLRRVKVASADPAKAALCAVLEQMPPDRDLPHLMRSVTESKHPIVVEQVTLQYIESLAQGPGHLQALQATATTSLVAVPLLMRGRPLGALVFTSSTPSRVYGQGDLRLAESLADRAAVAIENARLYGASVHATQLRDQMLSVVAHDLRNPLATILLQASAQKRRSPELERRSQKPVEVIHRAATHMNRLIQDLLAVALMEASQLIIERVRLSAGELVVEAVDMQRALASSSSLELRVDVDRDVPAIWGDRDRLLQVFENLIGNAIKFTKAGGRIRAGAASGDDEVVFWVADTGCGISAESLPRVFDRFWQATRADRQGAGLGLPIARGIVEAHGGRIWVESTQGQGTTFSFTIPAASSEQDRLAGC
jgi:PAS domain S-box-containing protein